MKKIISLMLVLMLAFSMLVIPAAASSAATATISAKLAGYTIPSAGEKFFVNVVVDDISSGKFLSGSVDFSWPVEVASLARYSMSTPMKASFLEQAIGNLENPYNASTGEGKYSVITAGNVNDGTANVGVYVDPAAISQSAESGSTYRLYSIAFILNEGYTFNDFCLEIDEVELFLGEGVSVSTISSGDVDVFDIEEDSFSSSGSYDGVMKASLTGDVVPVPGEKFTVAIELSNVTSGVLKSAGVQWNWPSDVAKLVMFAPPTVINAPVGGAAVGNLHNPWSSITYTGMFVSAPGQFDLNDANGDGEGQGDLAIYVDTTAKQIYGDTDAIGSDSTITMYEVAFVLNEGQSYDDFYFTLKNAEGFFGNEASTSKNGEIKLIPLTVKEPLPYISDTAKNGQPGYSEGSDEDGIFPLFKSFRDDSVMSFTLQTNNPVDSLIAFNSIENMASDSYFYLSTVMMKIDGNQIKVRDGNTIATIGELSSAETTVDVVVEISPENNAWSVTFVEDGSVVAQANDLAFGYDADYIDCVVLWDNNADESLTITDMSFEYPEVTVAFNANEGTCAVDSKDFTFGSSYGELPVPERVGYTFNGWLKDGVKVEATDNVYVSHTLTADWTINTYTVTFDANGGECATESLDVDYNNPYKTLPVPERVGYTFNGWLKDGVKVSEETVVTEAHTLVADWTINTYTVTFDANGGECATKSLDVDYNNPYGTLPVPERVGYTFNGWFKDGVEVTDKTVVTEAHTLVADWTIITYTVAFDSDGGSDVESMNINHGDTYGELPVPEKWLYTFEGWYLDGVKVDEDTVVVTNHTLVAQWEIVPNEIHVGEVSGYAGLIATLPISVESNPGFSGFELVINYGEGITPIEIAEGILLENSTVSTQFGNGSVTVSLNGSKNITDDGELLLVTFAIDADAKGMIDVAVEYAQGDIVNKNGDDVAFVTVAGSVTAIEIIKGDVTEDRMVNTDDLDKLNQYAAEHEVAFSDYESIAADVYTDDVIDMRDNLKVAKLAAGLNADGEDVAKVGSVTFEVGKLTGVVNGYVDVPVSIIANDGLSAFKLTVNYDKDLLTPVAITKGELLGDSDLVSNLDTASVFEYITAVWTNANGNLTDTGVAFTVRFKINKTTASELPVTVEYTDGNVIGENYEQLNVNVIDGFVFFNATAEYLVEEVTLTNSVVNVTVREVIERNKDAVLVVAAYEGDCMVDIYTEVIDPVTGAGVYREIDLNCSDNAEIKVFVVEKLTSLKSISYQN